MSAEACEAPIKVLVVDDAVAVRRLLTMIIQDDPELELVGIAADGRIALSKIELLRPDIISLDIAMPEMDGLAMLREMKRRGLPGRVLVFSTLTQHGAKETIEALALGADDYITKPTQYDNPADAVEAVRAELIPRIKAIVRGRSPGGRTNVGPDSVVEPAGVAPSDAPAKPLKRVDLLAIGSSTGGPNALATVLAGLPKSLRVPVVIAQHMPPMYTMYLAQRLDSLSALTVREAIDGEPLENGTVYIAPGDHHLTLRRTSSGAAVRLEQTPPVNHCRPSVDVLFRSAATAYGGNTLCVVLTGMGRDGCDGVSMLQQQGGHVIVQDQATSVVWGMPGSVADAGLADEVLPLGDIASAIVLITGNRSGARRATQ